MRTDDDRRKSLFFAETPEKLAQPLAKPEVKVRNTIAAAARGEGRMSRESSAMHNAAGGNVVAAMTVGRSKSLGTRVQFPVVFEVRNAVAGDVFAGIPGEIGGHRVLAAEVRRVPLEDF
jgi:hypothetical protein